MHVLSQVNGYYNAAKKKLDLNKEKCVYKITNVTTMMGDPTDTLIS